MPMLEYLPHLIVLQYRALRHLVKGGGAIRHEAS